MKTYTLTPAAQEAFDEWYRISSPSIIEIGTTKVLESFFTDHPEHMTEQQSTSKRDEVLRVATAIYAGYCANERFVQDIKTCTTIAINLIAEVDKRFNTKEG